MAVEQINAEDFENLVLNSDKPVFVDFSATWCNPCKMYEPIFEEFSNEHPECDCFRIDIDQNTDLTIRHEVSAVPTTLVFNQGQRVTQMLGVVNKISLEITLEGLL